VREQLREQLIDEVFAIGSNASLWDIREAQAKIARYQQWRSKDPQLDDLFRMLEIFAIENEYGDYDASYKIAKPMFERLLKTDNWDFCDICLFAALCDCHLCGFEQLNSQVEIGLQRLERYSHKERYQKVKLALHMNLTFRLNRLSHIDDEVRYDLATFKRFETIFLRHIDAALEISETEGLFMPKAHALVRKGSFYKNEDLIKEGFELLKLIGDDRLYRILEKELKEYEQSERLIAEAREYNANIGKNIKKIRTERRFSEYKLSKALNVLPSYITMVEEGRKNITVYNLQKAADALGVPIIDLTAKEEIVDVDDDYDCSDYDDDYDNYNYYI